MVNYLTVLSKNLQINVDKNIDFFVMYGQTEGTSRLSYLNPDKILEKLGSVGKAIPGGEFRLVNDKNEKIELANIEGELVYIGKCYVRLCE